MTDDQKFCRYDVHPHNRMPRRKWFRRDDAISRSFTFQRRPFEGATTSMVERDRQTGYCVNVIRQENYDDLSLYHSQIPVRHSMKRPIGVYS